MRDGRLGPERPEDTTSAVVLSIVAAGMLAIGFVIQSNAIAIVSMALAVTAAMKFASAFQKDARRRAMDPDLHIGRFEREIESLPLEPRVEPDSETEDMDGPTRGGPT